jgi:hypothetical protein
MGRASRAKAQKSAQEKDRTVLLRNLAESEGFLDSSAHAFDNGYEAEAKRLAVTLRVLLHDTKQSHSLLSLLKVKEKMQFTDTAEPINPANLLPTPGLVMMKFVVGEESSYVAPLDMLSPPRINPPADFTPWWNNDVTKDKDGNLWSRKSFVLTLANNEGGAHVDPALNQKYEALVRDNGLGWQATTPDGTQPFLGSPAAAAVRQITYEVLDTLRRYSNLLS